MQSKFVNDIKHVQCKHWLDMENDLETEGEIPWPKSGDALFKPDDDWWMNACLGISCNRWNCYAIGFKKAADSAVYCVEQYRLNQGASFPCDWHISPDTVVYPIVFLYRQYLELRLKEVIIHGSALLNLDPDWNKGHDILQLWKVCRSLFEQVWPGCEQESLKIVEGLIREFHNVDLSSEEFRYPITKDRKLKVFKDSVQGLTHINIRNLRDVMDRIANFLDSASCGISEYLEDKLTRNNEP